MFGIGFVCLSVFWWELCLALGLSVIFGNYVGHWVCLFVCLLGDLRLALRLSVIFGNYVWHWVCLFVGWVNYVWHWVCLFVCFCGNYVWHWVCLLFLGIMLDTGRPLLPHY